MTWSMRNACTARRQTDCRKVVDFLRSEQKKARSEGPTLYEGPSEAEYFLLRSCAPKCLRNSPETPGGSPEAPNLKFGVHEKIDKLKLEPSLWKLNGVIQSSYGQHL